MTEQLTLDQPRQCTHCQETKAEAAFGKNGRGDVGSTCNTCRNARRRARGESIFRRATQTPEQRLDRRLREEYKITFEQYVAMVAAQSGTCAICRQPPKPGKRLAVDHCHTTGVVRALLCIPCNIAVGFFEIHGQAAAEYLARYGAGNPLLTQ